MRDALRYAAAVLGYIALAMLTKRFLTWTYGPIYFITVLEVLPRVGRRISDELGSRFVRKPLRHATEPVIEP